MIKFENEPSTWTRLDYRIMMHGFLKPYINDAELRKDIAWLESEKYKVIEFDCREWDSKEKIHFFLSGKIDYVDGAGYSWGSLDEVLNQLTIPDSGLVIVFNYFDFIQHKMRKILIDCFIRSAQRHLMFEERLFVLIKVDNRNFALNPFGGFHFYWYE